MPMPWYSIMASFQILCLDSVNLNTQRTWILDQDLIFTYNL